MRSMAGDAERPAAGGVAGEKPLLISDGKGDRIWR